MDMTPLQQYANGTYAKRDDLAAGGVGAKGRQYAKMIGAQDPGLPLVVGCAATSAMQLYVPTMAKAFGRRAIVYTPGRKVKTAEQEFAERHGAEVHYVRPGYMSVVRKRAKDAGPCVRWVPSMATEDTAAQVASLVGTDVSRVVVAVGSGAAAVGVLVGLHRLGLAVPVLGVFVSDMADADMVMGRAEQVIAPRDYVPYEKETPADRYKAGMEAGQRPQFAAVQHPTAYDKGHKANLPDGTPLDPYYAAKASTYLASGDCLWVVGCRPVSLFR